MFLEASLQDWMPAIHAGMREFAPSSSVGERKIMNYFVVRSVVLFWQHFK
jgi:hypothetical protein